MEKEGYILEIRLVEFKGKDLDYETGIEVMIQFPELEGEGFTIGSAILKQDIKVNDNGIKRE